MSVANEAPIPRGIEVLMKKAAIDDGEIEIETSRIHSFSAGMTATAAAPKEPTN